MLKKLFSKDFLKLFFIAILGSFFGVILVGIIGYILFGESISSIYEIIAYKDKILIEGNKLVSSLEGINTSLKEVEKVLSPRNIDKLKEIEELLNSTDIKGMLEMIKSFKNIFK